MKDNDNQWKYDLKSEYKVEYKLTYKELADEIQNQYSKYIPKDLNIIKIIKNSSGNNGGNGVINNLEKKLNFKIEEFYDKDKYNCLKLAKYIFLIQYNIIDILQDRVEKLNVMRILDRPHMANLKISDNCQSKYNDIFEKMESDISELIPDSENRKNNYENIANKWAILYYRLVLFAYSSRSYKNEKNIR